MKTDQSPKQSFRDDDEFEEYASVGVSGLLAATAKLQAVNKGVTKPDEKDALPYSRVYTTDRLMKERIKLDNSKILHNILKRASRQRSLKGLNPMAFDGYTMGYLTGNPLVTPIEEINPMHLVEQRRRITRMGPGGIGDPNAITTSLQSVHGSQFGFIDPLQGPECFTGEAETLTREGWKPWKDVTCRDSLACRVNGKLEFNLPNRVYQSDYEGEMISFSYTYGEVKVTPGHRVYFKTNSAAEVYNVKTAEEIYKKPIYIPIQHRPEKQARGRCSHTVLRVLAIFLASCDEDWRFQGSMPLFPPFVERMKIPLHKFSAEESAAVFIDKTIEYLPEIVSWDSKRQAIYLDEKVIRKIRPMFPEGCRRDEVRLPDLFEKLKDEHFNEFIYYLKFITASSIEEESKMQLSSPTLIESIKDVLVRRGLNYVCGSSFLTREAQVFDFVRIGVPLGSSRQLKGGDESNKSRWSKTKHKGKVYCAKVPGSMVLTRQTPQSQPYWSGNSERAGVDVRIVDHARIGSDGNIYQVFRNNRTGKVEWVPSNRKNVVFRFND